MLSLSLVTTSLVTRIIKIRRGATTITTIRRVGNIISIFIAKIERRISKVLATAIN